MDLARKPGAVAIGDAGTTRVGRTKFVAGTMTVVAITAILGTALTVVSRGNVAPATQADPLVAAAAIEFRAGERGLTGTQSDPLVAAAAIEFRAGERVGAAQLDPLVVFRAGERGLTSTQLDPLVEFRAGERVGAAQ